MKEKEKKTKKLASIWIVGEKIDESYNLTMLSSFLKNWMILE